MWLIKFKSVLLYYIHCAVLLAALHPAYIGVCDLTIICATCQHNKYDSVHCHVFFSGLEVILITMKTKLTCKTE